jgi:chloramphenicol-sensitive protein RarD
MAYGIVAYGLWGIAPMFWKLLAGVPEAEILSHRVVWGVIAFAAFIAAAGAGPELRRALRDRRTLAVMALSGTMLAINWGTFIWSVATGHILEASLGYFIIPLMSVGLGMLVLGERMRRLQWLAIGFALIGVVVQTAYAGGVPWISLVVAISFGVYGLIRKIARVDSLVGSTVETLLLVPLAAGYLAIAALRGGGELGHGATSIQLLLISTGIITAAPLLCFNSAARRLPLSTLGFLQYLGPTCQFVLAIAVYGEPFAAGQLIAFGLIWLGLAVFSVDLSSGLVRAARAAAPVSRTAR